MVVKKKSAKDKKAIKDLEVITHSEAPVLINPAEEAIRRVGNQINNLLNENGLGMQAVIQIFQIKPEAIEERQKSSIIIPGSEDDNVPPGIIDAMRPTGDRIGT